MSLERMRKSFQSLFGLEIKPTKVPIKQEIVPSQISIESHASQLSQNKFTLISKKKERFNPQKFALQRLIEFYQNSRKVKDHDRLPVITYRLEKKEKKVQSKMAHPRWNQDESSSDCMGDSLNLRTQFAQNSVERLNSQNFASTNKQDIQPYYVQQGTKPISYKQSLQPNAYNIYNINEKQRFSTNAAYARSKIQFSREEQQFEPNLNQKFCNSRIKRTESLLGDDFLVPTFIAKEEKITDAEVPETNQTFLQQNYQNPQQNLIESKIIIDRTPKESINKFREIKKVEIQPFAKQSITREKSSMRKEDLPKAKPSIERQVIDTNQQHQLNQQTNDKIVSVSENRANQNEQQITNSEVLYQANQGKQEEVQQSIQIQQTQQEFNPFISQHQTSFVPPWQTQVAQLQPQFNQYSQPVTITLPFQNQNPEQNLFQSQNLFQMPPEPIQNTTFFPTQQAQPQQMTTNLFESTPFFPQQQSAFNTGQQSVQQSTLFPFQQPQQQLQLQQQQQQQSNNILFQTNSLGGGSFSAADQNQQAQPVNLFAAPQITTISTVPAQQQNLFSNDFTSKQANNDQNQSLRYKNKIKNNSSARIE